MSGTTDMTSWDLGQQEEDLENSKFRERAFHESIYGYRQHGSLKPAITQQLPYQDAQYRVLFIDWYFLIAYLRH